MTTTQRTPPISELLRDRRGDSYKAEVARTIGVSRQIYDAWETGHFVPGDEWAERLADYLERQLEEIVLQLYNDRIAKMEATSPRYVKWDAFGFDSTMVAFGSGHPGWEAA